MSFKYDKFLHKGRVSMAKLSDLVTLPFFRDLNDDEIHRFLHATGTIFKRYAKGDRILRAYEDNPSIGVLLDGTGQVLTEDRFGNESASHILERGAILGSSSAILGAPGIASVVALADTHVLWVTWRALITAGTRLGRIHGIVMKNLLEAFCRKNYLMTQQIEVLSQKTLRDRIILYLLQREQRQGTTHITVPGRTQLARELSCNRSALTREIATMEREGLVTMGDDWLALDHAKIDGGRK